MPGLKRARVQDDAAGDTDDVHPDRKRLREFSKTDAKLAKIYGDLIEHDSELRLRAAIDLLETIKSQSSEQDAIILKVLDRLIKGLCSSNKAARLGFSVALSEVVRLALDRAATGGAANAVDLTSLTARCVQITLPDSKANAQQTRDCLLGQRFAFQSILQSDAGLRKDVTEAQWKEVLSAIMKLAIQKDWLRSECGSMLYAYLKNEGRKLSSSRVQAIVDALQVAKLFHTAEGVALWLIIAEHWKETLPEGIWSKKDPFSSNEQAVLKKVMLNGADPDSDGTEGGKKSGSGTRQSRPNPAWHHVLAHLYQRGSSNDFARFWREVVCGGLLSKSSSDERKALGLQIVSLAVTDAPQAYLSNVLDDPVARVLVSNRADRYSYLFDAAKQVLDIIAKRGRSEPGASPVMLEILLRNRAFDQRTKAKTIEILVQQADRNGLDSIVKLLRGIIFDSEAKDSNWPGNCQQICADLLTDLIKSRKAIEQDPSGTGVSGDGGDSVVLWLEHALQVLVEAGYGNSSLVSESTRTKCRRGLPSSLASLLALPPRKLSTIFSAVLAALAASQKGATVPPSDKATQQALKSAGKARKQLAKVIATGEARADAASGFDILYGLSMLQVYNGESDSVETLNDLQASYEVWQTGEEASTGLIELLLSFLTKPSKALRTLSEQVFTVFAKDMTAESLQSLVDILQQKESLSGQLEVFKQDGEQDVGQDEDVAEGRDDAEAMDVEDMSDVELVNGEVLMNGVKDHEVDNGVGGSTSDEEEDSASSDGTSDTDEGSEISGEDDEETEFDRKLALALGSAAANEDDSGSDDADMDDSDMEKMEVDRSLANVLGERKKLDAQRQENKGAKENMINFKNRVLDLLSIYVKSQYGNVLALDLILPLVMLGRTSSSRDTQDKARTVLMQYFDACTKHKALPRPDDTEAVFEVLEAIHEEMKLGGSKDQSHACSRSSLFLAKVLVGMDVEFASSRIAELYGNLWAEWYSNAQSKVSGKVFRDWHDWSENTRRSRLEAKH